MPHQVMLVDDDAAVCWALDRALRRAGHQVVVCNGPAEATRRIAAQTPGVVLTDLRMPDGSGQDLLAALRRSHPRLPVVLMTAYGSMETAASAVGAGAYDYLPKPLDLARTLAVVERALGQRELAIESPAASGDGPVLIGTSPAMQEAIRRLALAAASALPVLITGPTGSGKELAARLIHQHSCRAAAPFVSITSGRLPAGDPHAGLRDLVAAATGGSLLLDEVGDLTPGQQAAVLALLSAPDCAVRLLATSCRDLTDAGGLRPELRHRLAVLTVEMPPLDACRTDLPTLAAHLLGRIAAAMGRPLALTDAALDVLTRRAWPGNVRELRHALEAGAALAPGGTIDVEHLRPPGGATPDQMTLVRAAEACLNAHPGHAHACWLEHHERPLIEAAITRTRGNALRAAELLGLHRTTLRRRLDELGLLPVDGGD